MIGQYKEAMSQIHAPSELIRRTQEKMKSEELRIQSQKSSEKKKTQGRRMQLTFALSMVAALVVLIIVPTTMGLTDGKTQIGKEFFAQKETPEVVEIQGAQGETEETEQKIEMTEVSEMPVEFDSVQQVDMEAYSYYLLQDKYGNYRAYVQMNEKGYLITSEIQEKDIFLQQMEALLLT